MRWRVLAGLGLAALALPAAASAQVAGTTGAAPPKGPTPFCVELVTLYGQLLGQPPGRRSGTDAVTYSIYRNSTAERLAVLAWAGQCDITALLSLEQRHMRDVLSAQSPSASAIDAGGRQ